MNCKAIATFFSSLFHGNDCRGKLLTTLLLFTQSVSRARMVYILNTFKSLSIDGIILPGA
jgi:hypothetical protein